MQFRERTEVQQIEIIPGRNFVQVKEAIIGEVVVDDGTVREVSRTGHRRVLTVEDAADLAAVFGDLNAQMAAALSQTAADLAQAQADLQAARERESAANQRADDALAQKDDANARATKLEAQLAALQPAAPTNPAT